MHEILQERHFYNESLASTYDTMVSLYFQIEARIFEIIHTRTRPHPHLKNCGWPAKTRKYPPILIKDFSIN